VNDTQEMQKKILDKLHFEVKIEEIAHPKGRVVICHIPSRPLGRPFHHDGRYWMRSGEELRAMSPDRLAEIFKEGKPDWLMESARSGLTSSEVVSLLDTRIYFERLGQPYPAIPRRVLERLKRDKIIGDDSKDISSQTLGLCFSLIDYLSLMD
jgi:ATP-dependent DNA helicase RecG